MGRIQEERRRKGTAEDVPLSLGGNDRAGTITRGTGDEKEKREWLLKQAVEWKAGGRSAGEAVVKVDDGAGSVYQASRAGQLNLHWARRGRRGDRRVAGWADERLLQRTEGKE